MPRTHRQSLRSLYEVAAGQQGFFTAKEAKTAGFAENTHPYHVQVGNWIREHRGIYRLALYPFAEHPDLITWALWSRNRTGVTEGTYSHQTALSLHELSDVNPSKLHMTVPTWFRRNKEIPGILILHRANLSGEDVETTQGFRLTHPLRTILDLVEADSVERGFLRQAVHQALRRGLISREEMARVSLRDPAQRRFDDIVRHAA